MHSYVYMFTCVCTHHEEDAEVGKISKEILHAQRVGVKSEVAAGVLVELLHVLVHGGELLILLTRMFAEAVRAGSELRANMVGGKQTKTDRQNTFTSNSNERYTITLKLCL